MSDDPHTPTTAAPTPQGTGAVSAGGVTPPEQAAVPTAPDAREGLQEDDKSAADKLREKAPEPVANAAGTAAAKASDARQAAVQKATAAKDAALARAAAAKEAALGAKSSAAGAASDANQAPADRPEILAGAAFAGGFVFAVLLRRLTR